MTIGYCIDENGFLISQVTYSPEEIAKRKDLILVTPPPSKDGYVIQYQKGIGWKYVLNDLCDVFDTSITDQTPWRRKFPGEKPPATAVLQTAETLRNRANTNRAWKDIKAAREYLRFAPIVVDGHSYDADPESVMNVLGAIELSSVIGPSFTVDWTLSDNTVVTLTGDQLKAVGVAMADRTSRIHQYSRTLRDRLNKAPNQAAIDAVQWNFVDTPTVILNPASIKTAFGGSSIPPSSTARVAIAPAETITIPLLMLLLLLAFILGSMNPVHWFPYLFPSIREIVNTIYGGIISIQPIAQAIAHTRWLA